MSAARRIPDVVTRPAESAVPYPRRLADARRRMAALGVDLMFLPEGANLQYLLGLRRRRRELTDHNAYGDYVTGAVIGPENAAVLAPRMDGAYWIGQAEGKPWVDCVRIVLEEDDPVAALARAAKLHGRRVQCVAVDDRAWARSVLALQRLLPGASFVPASAVLGPMRAVKDAGEIAVMRNAARLADTVFGEVLAILRPGMTELDVAAELELRMRRHGADGPAFVTGIIATGSGGPRARHAASRSTARAIAPGDTVAFDFGLVLDGYCADFGRSVFVGPPTRQQVGAYQAVVAAQTAAIAAMAADRVTAEAVDALATRAIASRGFGAHRVPVRLGHSIGIDVHETPALEPGERARLRAGMTFTVEPKIWIDGGCYVRVEDVVLVCPDGGEPLSRFSRDVLEV